MMHTEQLVLEEPESLREAHHIHYTHTNTHTLELEAAYSMQYCDSRALGQTLGQWQGVGPG